MFALPAADNALKRKRSPSATTNTASAPPPKVSKPANTTTTNATGNGASNGSSNQLQINYLARQSLVDLPFINKDDTLPAILEVLGQYSHVLDRHESLASNLGARPLGPNLIKRFERCFDAPPEIIASHSHSKNPQTGDDSTPTVTWLDVVHFAQAHPAQFTLSTFSEGRRVCQFYYPQKQVRVQISEEDFLFINSGRCQDLIPPLPIWEDEEKEVGTCEILEKTLRELTNAADLVAARTRQLGHRLKGRRMAILERRAGQNSTSELTEQDQQVNTPPTAARNNGFISVNAAAQSQAQPSKNGTAGPEKPDASATIRTDLLKHFQSLPHNQATPRLHEPRRISVVQPTSPIQLASQQTTKQSTPVAVIVQPTEQPQPSSSSASPAPTTYPPDSLSYFLSDGPPRPTALTPTSADNAASKHNFSRPLPPSLESVQPYRHICQQHMEFLPRGARVLPPCDRCRRLRMDCVKNLSSCAGCTKKHSRCHWKDVSVEEVKELEGFEDVGAETAEVHANGGASTYDGNGNVSGQLGDIVTPPPEELERADERAQTTTATHQAMDILRAMGGSSSNTTDAPAATNGAGSGNLNSTPQVNSASAAMASSIRNNGAFRSVYTSVYPPVALPADHEGAEIPAPAGIARPAFESSVDTTMGVKAGGEGN